MRKLTLILCLIALPVLAEDPTKGGGPPGGGPPGGGAGLRPHGPPPEAMEACKGKSKGAECSFNTPRGDAMAGNCDSPKADLPLACRPKQPSGGMPGGMPGGQTGGGMPGKAPGGH